MSSLSKLAVGAVAMILGLVLWFTTVDLRDQDLLLKNYVGVINKLARQNGDLETRLRRLKGYCEPYLEEVR